MACQFSALCAFIGIGKYFHFRQRPANFSTETDWIGTMLFLKKASVNKSCFVSLPSLRRSRGISNSVKRRAYLTFDLKGCSEGAWEDFGKISICVLICENGDLFAPQSSSSLTFRAGAGFIEPSLDCDSVV